MNLRFLIVLACTVSGFVASHDVAAQVATVRTGNILVLDQASLLTGSQLGKDILALELAEQETIIAAGQQINSAYEAEEQFLTEQRDILPPDEFRILAEAFNDKVEETRAEQSAGDEAQLARIEARRRAFYQAILPYLGEIIRRYNASAILDRRSVLLFDKNLDITLETIALLDQEYAQNPDMIEFEN